MIFSGQLDSGTGSFWRVRDTYNYRPDENHDFKISAMYGRMNARYPGSGSISSQLLSDDEGLRDSGLQTLAFDMEASTKLLDLLTVNYGFNYTHFRYGKNVSLIYPSIQILFTPTKGWSFQTSITSRHVSDLNSIVLPEGDILNLTEPASIVMIGNQVSMNQVRHSEVGVERAIDQRTAMEFAVYQDRMQGSGLPLMVTTNTRSGQQTNVIQLDEAHSSQRGMRVTLKHTILDCLKGSVDYVYGEAASISNREDLFSGSQLESGLNNYVHQHYQHSITGRLKVNYSRHQNKPSGNNALEFRESTDPS